MTALSNPLPEIGDDELTEAERALIAAAATGAMVDLRTGDTADDPANGANWPADRTVRAGLLADLLTGERIPPSGRIRAVNVCGAWVVDQLDLQDRKIICPLLMGDCSFDKPIALNRAEAMSVRLPGCRVPALFAALKHATGNVELNEQFTADGPVRLLGANIDGQLVMNAATLNNSRGPSLDARGLTVDQDMHCGDGFKAHGEVRLLGAHIGGQFTLRGASLDNRGGEALFADGLIVDQSMFCRARFTTHGEVRLTGAQVRGDGLDVETMRLFDPGESSLALNEATLTVLRLPSQKPAGAINLSGAKVGALIDDPDACPEVLHLRGFAYDTLQNQDVSCRTRLQWVRRHPARFVPQIYDQLADCYRRAGEDAKARKVMVAKQWRRRHAWNPLSLLWYVTVGYGYRTWQALLWLAVLTATGTAVFSHAHMVSIVSHPPAFHPFIYTLDLLMPVVGLGQKAAWQPAGNGLDWFGFALTGTGWVLATAVVAGLTGILNRSK